MPTPGSQPVAFAISGPITRADLPGLCARVCRLLSRPTRARRLRRDRGDLRRGDGRRARPPAASRASTGLPRVPLQRLRATARARRVHGPDGRLRGAAERRVSRFGSVISGDTTRNRGGDDGKRRQRPDDVREPRGRGSRALGRLLHPPRVHLRPALHRRHRDGDGRERAGGRDAPRPRSLQGLHEEGARRHRAARPRRSWPSPPRAATMSTPSPTRRSAQAAHPRTSPWRWTSCTRGASRTRTATCGRSSGWIPATLEQPPTAVVSTVRSEGCSGLTASVGVRERRRHLRADLRRRGRARDPAHRGRGELDGLVGGRALRAARARRPVRDPVRPPRHRAVDQLRARRAAVQLARPGLGRRRRARLARDLPRPCGRNVDGRRHRPAPGARPRRVASCR